MLVFSQCQECDLYCLILVVVIIQMCDHLRRPRLFCLNESCSKPQCSACTLCTRNLHAHSIEHFASQKQIHDLLSRFELPANLKEQRQKVILTLYKFLTRFKNEVTNQMQEMVGDMMSKVKYPFLYQGQYLDSYRHIRDKQYQRLNPCKFRSFCSTANKLDQLQFISQEELFYNQHLKENQSFLKNINAKINAIQTAFNLKIDPQVYHLYRQFQKESQFYLKNHKLAEKPSAEEVTIRGKVDSVLKGISKDQTSYLTPTKSSNKYQDYLENMSINVSSARANDKSSIHDYRYKDNKSCFSRTSELKDKDNLDITQSATFQRIKTAEEAGKTIQKQKDDSDVKTIKSSFSAKNSDFQSTRINQRSDSLFLSYNEPTKNSLYLKANEASTKKQIIEKKSEPDTVAFLNNSIQLNNSFKSREITNRKDSFNEEMSHYMREREENIQRKLNQLRKITDNIDENNRKKQFSKLKKESKKPSPQKKKIGSPPKLDKQVFNKQKPVQNHYVIDKKQKKSPTKLGEVKGDSKGLAGNKSHSPNKDHNVSLNKYFMPFKEEKKANDSLHLNLGNITKNIPLQVQPAELSPGRKPRLQRKESLQTTATEELQASCMLMHKIADTKDKAKLRAFLQRFTDKFQNSITGVEYLSYLYLEEGNAKQCLLLTSNYLGRMASLQVNEAHKVNLLINQSAALNLLGRSAETVALLTKTLNSIQHQKLHKNLGDAHYNQGVIDKAIYHYERATKLRPTYDEAYYNLAVMLYLQQNYCNALMNIEKAIRFQPKNEHYLELLAAIKERRSNRRQ